MIFYSKASEQSFYFGSQSSQTWNFGAVIWPQRNIKKICPQRFKDIAYKYLFRELLHRITNCGKLQIRCCIFTMRQNFASLSGKCRRTRHCRPPLTHQATPRVVVCCQQKSSPYILLLLHTLCFIILSPFYWSQHIFELRIRLHPVS
jgi:hypothetical protein